MEYAHMTTLSFQDAVTLVSAVNNRIDVGQAAVDQGYAELDALDKCIIEAGLDPVEVSVIALGIPREDT
jgi:hypothetical protein